MNTFSLLDSVTFSKDKVVEWSEALQAATLIVANGDPNLTNGIGLSYLKVLSYRNADVKSPFSVYKNNTPVAQQTFLGALEAIVNRYIIQPGVRRTRILSRILHFKFVKLSQEEMEAFNRLLDEYAEIAGAPLDDDTICTSITKALPKDVVHTLTQ